MARTRTLAQLRADVCDRADIADGGAGGRHPSATLNRRINQAIQQFTRLVTDGGVDTYIKSTPVSTSVSSTPDAANWAPRDYLALPSDFYHLAGIDITYGTSTIAMQDFMSAERNMFREQPFWLSGSGIGMPVLYRLGGSNAAGARIVKVIPSADAVYTCAIWYLPVFQDLVSDSDTFDGIAGYEEWVVNRAAMDSLVHDNTNQVYVALINEQRELEAQMTYQFAAQAGPGRRMDTRARRNMLTRYSRGDWRAL